MTRTEEEIAVSSQEDILRVMSDTYSLSKYIICERGHLTLF